MPSWFFSRVSRREKEISRPVGSVGEEKRKKLPKTEVSEVLERTNMPGIPDLGISLVVITARGKERKG